MLNHGDYDGFKSSLTRVALRKGYFDSEFLKSQLGVSSTVIRRSGISITTAANAIALATSLSLARKSAMNTCKTSCRLKRATTTPRRTRRAKPPGGDRLVQFGGGGACFAKSRKTKVLPLQGVVSPRKENTVETGVGYSTDVGPRVKATWKTMGQLVWPQPDLQRQPLRPEQQFDFTYKVPLLKSP